MSPSGQKVRAAGADPGSSSLDLVILEDGRVADQARFSPVQVRGDPTLPSRWLQDRGSFDLVAGPSGYGLPLLPPGEYTEQHLALMALVHPRERDEARGVAGFSAVAHAFLLSGLPVVFLPGVIHLQTVPSSRKINRIDLGTADKLCVAALAAHQRAYRKRRLASYHACVIEAGSVFTACMVLEGGRIVDGVGGTSGCIGWGSGGAWDGEAAYLLSPLRKHDLFQGGVSAIPDRGLRGQVFKEALLKVVAGLRASVRFEEIVLAGRLMELEPDLMQEVKTLLTNICPVAALEPLPGAWVKHAAQGAAILADGLAGGACRDLVDHLGIREAQGSVLDWLVHPGAEEIRRQFLSSGQRSGPAEDHPS